MQKIGIITSVGFAALAVSLAIACSSSTTPTPAVTDGGATTDGSAKTTTDGSTGTDGSALCGVSENAKVTAVSKTTPSDPGCPDVTPAELNADDPDAGPDPCKVKIDAKACTAKFDCSDANGSSKGTFTASGNEFKGTLTVTIKDGDGGTMTCNYSLTLK